jgi:hypothetical protein
MSLSPIDTFEISDISVEKINLQCFVNCTKTFYNFVKIAHLNKISVFKSLKLDENMFF